MAAVFGSGAKSSEEKPRYDLIPACALRRYAERLALGAKLHGEDNWQKGVGDPAYIRDRLNHTIEHLLKYASGDRAEDHLAAVLWGAGALCWFEEHAPRAPVPVSEPVEHVGPEGWIVPDVGRMGR
jgi:hypothetical protein